MSKSPVAIIILDGFGWRPEVEGNAVAQAKKPIFVWPTSEFPICPSGRPTSKPDAFNVV